MTLQGQVLAGRYALGVLLGAGGMGQVYRARDRVLERAAAVGFLLSLVSQGIYGQRAFRRDLDASPVAFPAGPAGNQDR
jgi:hypothetical protein